MFRSSALRLIMATVFVTAIAASSSAAQPQGQSGNQDKHLDIQSSAGDLHLGNDADARKAGLPLYPGRACGTTKRTVARRTSACSLTPLA